jgi:predicted nucleic acid-binding protein
MKKTAFIDTTGFLAIIGEKDPNHLRIQEIIVEYSLNTTIAVQNQILNICIWENPETAIIVNKYIVDNVKIYHNEKIYNKSLEKFHLYDGSLFLTDCTLLCAMEDKKIINLISFNDKFDKKSEIKRIY